MHLRDVMRPLEVGPSGHALSAIGVWRHGAAILRNHFLERAQTRQNTQGVHGFCLCESQQIGTCLGMTLSRLLVRPNVPEMFRVCVHDSVAYHRFAFK